MCWVAALGSRTLSTRLKASMAADAAANDAHRNAKREIAARMMMLKEYQYLKAKYCRKEIDMSTLEEVYVGVDIGGGYGRCHSKATRNRS